MEPNLMIGCRAHNNDQGDRDLDTYLKQGSHMTRQVHRDMKPLWLRGNMVQEPLRQWLESMYVVVMGWHCGCWPSHGLSRLGHRVSQGVTTLTSQCCDTL